MTFLPILLLLSTTAAAEIPSSIPCEYTSSEKLLCRQTSFIDENIPWDNQTFYSQITHFEWIESGAYILSHHRFDLFLNLQNVSLRSNALTSLAILPFWSHLKHISHLDLSQNRLISINQRDFQNFHQLQSLNVSFNFLTTIEPIWLTIPLHLIDLSQNGINFLGYTKLQNGTSEMHSCLLQQIYLNDNRGLLSFSQLQTTIIDVCPFIDRFQLINNHWHCACNDLINSLKRFRALILLDDPSRTLSGSCETPLSLRHIDIQKINEELVCDRMILLDSVADDQTASLFHSRQIILLFLLGCLIGLLTGLCLHYCTRRCHDIIFYLLLKCDRQKEVDDRTATESIQISEATPRSNRFIYYPTRETDALPSYSQVMNDIFYLDILTRRESQNDGDDGEC